ncbi:MAG: hypothetical protein ACFFEY_19160 [Candidatus Thorarchaeota archaeon]
MTEKDYQTENDNESNFEKILEDSIKDDLAWVEREFELLFRYKKVKTKEDIEMGNKIISQIVDIVNSYTSEFALNLLTITLNRIEQSYPEFF